VKAQIHKFLTSAVHEEEWSASCYSRFIQGGKNPGNYWIRYYQSPKDGLDLAAKGKNPLPVPTGKQTAVIQPSG